MKRGMAGKTRRGAPPLPRQRTALRVVQVTLLGVGLYLAWLATLAWSAYVRSSAASSIGTGRAAPVGLGEVVVLGAGALLFFGFAVAMGMRAVRGPAPPDV